MQGMAIQVPEPKGQLRNACMTVALCKSVTLHACHGEQVWTIWLTFQSVVFHLFSRIKDTNTLPKIWHMFQKETEEVLC